MATAKDSGKVHSRVQPGKRTWRQRQEFVVGRLMENRGNGTYEPMGAIMLQAGYSTAAAKNPHQVTRSRTFQELLEEKMPDDMLQDVHTGLLKSTKIEHMVFPLGPQDNDDPNLSGATPNAPSIIEKGGVKVERTTLSDQEIKEMLAEVNCKVRRIVHGDTARHVYYWAPDTKSRSDALKLAYDIKGRLGSKDKEPSAGNTFNTQVNINDNTPRGNEVVQAFTKFMLQQTKSDTAGEKT